MKRNYFSGIVFAYFIFMIFSFKPVYSQTGDKVKNIILLIGDGMGTDQVYAAMTVSKDKLNFERAKYIGFSKTYSLSNFTTDSGAGGTAIATGTKTKNHAVGVDFMGNPLKSILVYAEEHGKSTGIVTTCDLTHATPATFVAHQLSRYSLNEIALDFLNVDVDVLIGGGRHRFDSLGVTKALRDKGYNVSRDLNSIRIKDTSPIICQVAEEHPLSILEGRDPNFLQNAVDVAMNKLNRDPEGFFLMVEGSQIDWGGHDNDLEYVISETLDFDKAVGKAFDFADQNPGTLVIITADHETGGLTLLDGDRDKHLVDGQFSTDGHTGVMVPIYAYGTGSEAFSHIMQNTDIFKNMMSAFGF
jgi:alkaline phosphatase